LDVSFDAQLGSPAIQNSFWRYSWLIRSTVALRRQRSPVRTVSGAPFFLILAAPSYLAPEQ
jgi:hypothetical protein